MQYKAN